jgi:hypothetical protein
MVIAKKHQLQKSRQLFGKFLLIQVRLLIYGSLAFNTDTDPEHLGQYDETPICRHPDL